MANKVLELNEGNLQDLMNHVASRIGEGEDIFIVLGKLEQVLSDSIAAMNAKIALLEGKQNGK